MADPHHQRSTRKAVLRVLLSFLVLTALIAIIDVWTDVDEDGKVLLSTFVISLASLLGLCGAARIDSDSRAPTGLSTLLLATLAALGTLWLIWVEPRDVDWPARVVGSSWLWALTTALHALIGLASLPDRWRWLGIAAPAAIHFGSALATAAIFELIEFNEDLFLYSLTTIYILAALGSLAVLIIHLMHRHDGDEHRRLVLLADADGMWHDGRTGKRYRVSELT